MADLTTTVTVDKAVDTSIFDKFTPIYKEALPNFRGLKPRTDKELITMANAYPPKIKKLKEMLATITDKEQAAAISDKIDRLEEKYPTVLYELKARGVKVF